MDRAAPIPKPMLRMPTEQEMLKDIWLKMPVLEKLSEKIDRLCDRVDGLEVKMKALENGNNELETGLSHLEIEVEEVKSSLETKAIASEMTKVKMQITDLVNRNKRNNVILHNVPEGAEGSNADCTELVHTFIRDSMGIPQAMEIERAHRTPMTRMTSRHDTRPRPIHVRFLRYRDRERVLKTSTQKKNLEIKGKRIFVSDDVHYDTREQHRRLMKKVKEMREKGNFAFIPWSVPRVIKFKEGGKDVVGPLKTMRDPMESKHIM